MDSNEFETEVLAALAHRSKQLDDLRRIARSAPTDPSIAPRTEPLAEPDVQVSVPGPADESEGRAAQGRFRTDVAKTRVELDAAHTGLVSIDETLRRLVLAAEQIKEIRRLLRGMARSILGEPEPPTDDPPKAA